MSAERIIEMLKRAVVAAECGHPNARLVEEPIPNGVRTYWTCPDCETRLWSRPQDGGEADG